jgi:hypothetical protein
MRSATSFVAAGRALVVGSSGRVITVSQASKRSLTRRISVELEMPIARLLVAPNDAHVEVVALICRELHDPHDQDLHASCDGPSEVVHVRLEATTGREVGREVVTHDDEPTAIGIAGTSPVVLTGRSVYRLVDGAWSQWAAADAGVRPNGSTEVCPTDGGLVSLDLPSASGPAATATSSEAQALGHLSFLSDAPGSTWTEVAMPEGVRSPESLACTPTSVVVESSDGTGSSLLVARGGDVLAGHVIDFDGPLIGLDPIYDVGELIDLEVVGASARRTVVIDPTDASTVHSTDAGEPLISTQDLLSAFCGRLGGSVVRVFAEPDDNGRYIETVKP